MNKVSFGVKFQLVVRKKNMGLVTSVSPVWCKRFFALPTVFKRDFSYKTPPFLFILVSDFRSMAAFYLFHKELSSEEQTLEKR